MFQLLSKAYVLVLQRFQVNQRWQSANPQSFHIQSPAPRKPSSAYQQNKMLSFCQKKNVPQEKTQLHLQNLEVTRVAQLAGLALLLAPSRHGLKPQVWRTHVLFSGIFPERVENLATSHSKHWFVASLSHGVASLSHGVSGPLYMGEAGSGGFSIDLVLKWEMPATVYSHHRTIFFFLQNLEVEYELFNLEMP